MAVATQKRKTTIQYPCLMVVEDDPGVGYAVTRWLQSLSVKPILATTTREALELINDVAFIEANLDGLLVDYNLPDATGVRVIQEFVEEFPGIPVAIMTGSNDLSLEMWAQSNKVPIFHKPLHMPDMLTWIEKLKPQAVA